MNITVVCVPSVRWPKMHWFADALRRIGHSVTETHCVKRLAELDGESDIVLFQQKSPIRWPNLRELASQRKSVWCQLWFDLIALESRCPLSSQALFASHRKMMEAMDVVFVKEMLLVNEYRKLGIRAVWMDQGVPADMIAQTEKPCLDGMVLLWGQGRPFYSRRFNDASDLSRAGYKVVWISGPSSDLFESRNWVPPHELVPLASEATAVLSVGRRNDIQGYVSDAHWLSMASGRPVLKRLECDMTPGPCLTYNTTEGLLKHVEWVVGNPQKATELGRKAATWLSSNNTLEMNAGRVVRCAREARRFAGRDQPS